MLRAPPYGLRLSLLVGLGSAIGALMRGGLSEAMHYLGSDSRLLATGLANVSGSFLIAWIAARPGAQGSLLARSDLRLFLLTGFCGGYTTLSLFSLDTVLLALGGAYGAALLHSGVSATLWLLAAAAGWRLGRGSEAHAP